MDKKREKENKKKEKYQNKPNQRKDIIKGIRREENMKVNK